jgi:hypothetical protein
MAATTYDLTIEQGATFSLVITYKDNDTPIDLSGYTARMQVRATAESATVLIELTTANGRIVLGPWSGGAAGTITLTIAAADTAALTAGRALYDLELISGSVVTRLIQGVCTISRNITR